MEFSKVSSNEKTEELILSKFILIQTHKFNLFDEIY